ATLAQALLFGGLCLVVDSFSSRRRITLASLGGLALGLTVLAGTGFLLMLLPVIPVAGALLASRRPQAIPLTAGCLAGVIGGLAAVIALDDPALGTTTPSLRTIGVLSGGLAVVTAAGRAGALAGPARPPAPHLLGGRGAAAAGGRGGGGSGSAPRGRGGGPPGRGGGGGGRRTPISARCSGWSPCRWTRDGCTPRAASTG